MLEEEQDASQLISADFMARFIREKHAPRASIEHFRRIQWINSQYLSNPAYGVIPTFSRHLKTNGEDYFFSRTINTPDTVPHFITLQLKDMKTPEHTTTSDDPRAAPPADPASHRMPTVVPELPDVVCLLQLSNPGIDGHPSIMHGGVTCAILDETMGFAVMLHDHNTSKGGSRDSWFTANLNVSYRAPVATPQAVIVRMWMTKRQGRKCSMKGQIVDENGKVLVEADGLWIAARKGKL